MIDDGEARVAALIAKAGEVAPELGAAATEKPRLLVDRSNPDVTVADLRDVLAESGEIFDRGVPVRLVQDAQLGTLIAHPMTAEAVVLIAHTRCRPYLMKTGTDGVSAPRDCALPTAHASMYLAWKGNWKLRPFNGVACAPLLGADGSITSSQGFDPRSGFYLEGVPDVRRLVPDRPRRSDVDRCLRVLRNLFSSFCFADAPTVHVPDIDHPVVDIELPPGRDEAGFLIGLLTAVCRPSLLLAPGLLISSAAISGSGSGKGLLARAIAGIAYGSSPRAVTAGGSAQEVEKRIGAELIAGGPMLFLDNLNDRAFKSDLLASAITECPARVRVLGKSEMVSLNASAFVVLTGNGLTLSEDLARRFVIIELDARTEDPESRRFDVDILAEIRTRRHELLAAALTIWRWGRLEPTLPAGRPLGSFAQWCKWVRDPLLALGCPDPAERTSDIKLRDSKRQSIANVFRSWWDHHADRPVTVNKLHEAVRSELDPQGHTRQWLTARVERLAGVRLAGFVLTRQTPNGSWGTATYALCRDEAEHRGHRDHSVAEASDGDAG